MKTCKICKEQKPKSDFGISNRHKDGLNPKCKACERDYRQSQRLKNGDSIKKKQKDWYENNKERILAERKEYRLENLEQIREYDRDRYCNDLNGTKSRRKSDKYIQTRREYYRNRRKQDPIFKLKDTVRCGIRHGLFYHGGYKHNRKTWDILPYAPEQLKEHLESQFDDKMSWDNYGSYWHIDHIYPQSLLPYDSLEHENFQKCWALENLRPLEAIENIKKSNNIIE